MVRIVPGGGVFGDFAGMGGVSSNRLISLFEPVPAGGGLIGQVG
jgi:hypothetical protein